MTQRSGRRRAFLKATGALGLVGLAGCITSDGNGDGDGNGEGDDDGNGGGNGNGNGGDDGDNTVRYVLNPAESDADIVAEYEPLFEYLEEETGAEIDPQPVSDYTATLEALRNGQAEIADASPSAAIAGENDVDIVGIRVAYGSDQYFSTITTTPDSGIEELTDLEGEEIAFSDNLSISGAMYPLYMLSQAGLDVGEAPLGDPVDFSANYSDHSTAREELINRDDVMAAGTGEFAVAAHIPAEQFSEEFAEIAPDYEDAGTEEPELFLLAESEPIPNAPIVTRSDWDDPIREDLERALLEAEEEDIVPDPDADDALWFTGVEEGDQEDLDPIRDVMDELGIEFADFEDEE